MKYTIFYSWQSDLPNSTNRSFIEKCIQSAIETDNDLMEMQMYFDYDRDTKNVTGSPDITDIIFNKIEKSDLFICDISIINRTFDGRKTPNPNVLIELGYAARVLGWERIICMYNLAYGDLDDLPFDLSHKRIFTYNSNQTNQKPIIAKGIAEAIKQIYAKGMLFNPLKDHIKGKIDNCMLEILKQICCLSIGTISMSDSLRFVNEYLSYDYEQLKKLASGKIGILGFFAHKDLENIKKELQEIFSAIVSSNFYPNEWAIVVLNVLNWIRRYQFLISDRNKNTLYKMIFQPSIEYEVVPARDINNDNRKDAYILLKKIGSDSGKVLNTATMPMIDKKYLVSPHYLREEAIEDFVKCIFQMSTIANKWLDENGNEFLFDPDYYYF